MKLSRLDMINRHADVRKQLQRQLACIDGRFASEVAKRYPLIITIDGERMDDALVAVAVPAIRNELVGRIASIDRDLEALGVEIS